MRILYVTTTFPVRSETFLQREAAAMLDRDVDLKILSLHRGEEAFASVPIWRFRKVQLVKLLYLLPWNMLTNWGRMKPIFSAMLSRKPNYALNFWENLLGFGAAIVSRRQAQSLEVDSIHCVWASAPVSFGWMLSQLAGIPFSMGAHAYDVFEFGGDWLLPEKAAAAELIHTTTNAAKERLEEHVDASKIRLIYRGLTELGELRSPRASRSTLRIICSARLVEKKGFPLQMKIYQRMKEAGISFEARIMGEGPLRGEIESMIKAYGLEAEVTLLGWVEQKDVRRQLEWADALVHTGIIAKSGDRDGLPNVIPEAMAVGSIVLASPVSGVVEAIRHEETGLLQDPEAAALWVESMRRIQNDDSLVEKLQKNARAWVEGNFVARKNTGELIGYIKGIHKK